MSQRLTPKFLPRHVVRETVASVLDGFVFNPKMNDFLSRKMCHIVVLVPSVEDTRADDDPDWPTDQPVTPHCIYEIGIGTEELWPHPFDDIARSKAMQLWHGQNTDGNTDSMPHLLFPGDTP